MNNIINEITVDILTMNMRLDLTKKGFSAMIANIIITFVFAYVLMVVFNNALLISVGMSFSIVLTRLVSGSYMDLYHPWIIMTMHYIGLIFGWYFIALVMMFI